MPMNNLIAYSDNYSKTSGSLWQYCQEIPAINDQINMGLLLILMGLMLLIHLILKRKKITGQTVNNNNDGNIAGRVDVEIMVPLKYQRNFWRTLEMPLINCEI